MKQPEANNTVFNDASEALDPARRLAEFGWIIEPIGLGGIRLRTHGAVRVGVLCVSLVLLLLLGMFALFMYGCVSNMDRLPQDGYVRVFPTVLLLALLVGIGLPVAGILAHIVWLLFAREEWKASHNSLEVRRRMLGFGWGSRHQDGELVLEPHYTGEKRAFWRLAVKSHGRKHYLMQERAISERGTGIGFESTREEAEAVAQLLAQHTGWSVVSAQKEAEEAVRSTTQPGELPVALREHGFRAGVDEQLRLEILRPRRSQIGCGSVALLIGSIWLYAVGVALHSFAEHVGGVHEVLKDWPFLLLITPMLIGGAVVTLLGFVIIFSRKRWIVDRNLFVVRSRLFGWKSEQQYVDGVVGLARVGTKVDERIHWTWEVQLQDQTGRVVKKNLYNARDDDIPRQLAAVLMQHTGWALREAES
mgnify:FL=1